jgi:hypothetical protein
VLGWLAVIALALIVAWRGRRFLGTITRALNVASLALVIVPLVSIAPYDVGRLASGEKPTPAPSAGPTSPSTAGPDIYWFVFDRYPSATSARLAYGIENPIFDELRTRGFYIADASHANYQRTSASLQATFSAEFLNGRGHADIFGPTDRSAAFSRVQNSNIARFLKSRGYFYVHVGSDFSGTRSSVLADVNHAFDNRTDFDAAFVDSTALPGILRRTGLSGPRWARRYAWTTWEVNLLANLPPYPSPKFVFGHLLLPHTPYIFTADGSFVSDEANRDRPRTKQFTEQLTFTNARMLAIIDDLLAVPETLRPVIIVQADEGPYPSYIGLYPEITPVNTFRVLFNAYFDTDLPILPDESFSLDHPEPLEFPER